MGNFQFTLFTCQIFGGGGRKFKLTLNNEYAASFLLFFFGPLGYTKTIINEIEQLPNECTVIISKIDRELSFTRTILPVNTVPVNTPQAMAIIDRWHARWNTIIDTISRSFTITADLSGGLDTRACLTLLRKPNMEFGNINFFSIKNDNYTYPEDLEIASYIGKILGFKVNTYAHATDSYSIFENDVFCSWFVPCGSFCTQFALVNNGKYSKNIIFNLSGSAGLRDVWNKNYDKLIDSLYSRYVPNQRYFVTKTKCFMKKVEKELEYLYKHEKYTTSELLLLKVRYRNHFGRNMVRHYLANKIIIAPLLDSSLYAIQQCVDENSDLNLLYAIIYDRFLPELKDVKFDSGRKIKSETWRLAEKLNAIFPFCSGAAGNEEKFEVVVGQRIHPQECKDVHLPASLVAAGFETGDMRAWVDSSFGMPLYDFAIKYWKTQGLYPDLIMVMLATIRIFADIAQANVNMKPQMPDFPPQLDEEFYRARYMSSLPNTASCHEHWLNQGQKAGYLPCALSSYSNFRAYIRDLAKKRKTLIIGTGIAPCLKGENITYFTRESGDILKQYAMLQFGNTDNVPEKIDYVSEAGDLNCIQEEFDLIYCCYNTLERAPDIVAWFQNIDARLASSGIFCCTVSNALYTYQHFQPLTALGDILEAHYNPSLYTIKDYLYRRTCHTHNDAQKHWQGEHGCPNFDLRVEIPKAVDEWRQGVHYLMNRWRFTDATFPEIMQKLNETRLFNLTLLRLYPTPYGGNVFNAIFV